jgi:hypothetical protein
MTTTKKTIMILAAILIIALGVFFIWQQNKSVYSDSLTKEFFETVEQAQQKTLDLRPIKSVDWDELVYWSPYQDICSYGILEYDPDSANCEASTDDTEAYMLFLKENHLVGRVKVNNELTLFESDLGRVEREKAVFTFATQGKFPKVILKNEGN